MQIGIVLIHLKVLGFEAEIFIHLDHQTVCLLIVPLSLPLFEHTLHLLPLVYNQSIKHTNHVQDLVVTQSKRFLQILAS